MKLFKVRIRRKSTEIHENYIYTSSKQLAKDKAWVENAYDDNLEIFSDPIKEWSTLTITQATEVKSLKDINEEWMEQCPWFHPSEPHKERDLELKDYFKQEDKGICLRLSLEREMRECSYQRNNIDSRMKEISKKLKDLPEIEALC